MKAKQKGIAYFLSIFVLVLGMIFTIDVSAAKKVSLSNKKITITKGKSKTIKVKNTKKKVTWKILSGKKYISLKKKGKTAATIRGKKKGTAKVQAKVGKKKMTCTVKVKNAKQLKKTNQSNPPVSKITTQTPTPPAGTNPIGTSTPDNKPKKKVVSISYSYVNKDKYAFLEKGKHLVYTKTGITPDFQAGEKGIDEFINVDVKYADGTTEIEDYNKLWDSLSFDFSKINYNKVGTYDVILTYEGLTCKIPIIIAERKTEGLYTYLTDGEIAELKEMIGDERIEDEDGEYHYEFTSATLEIPATLGGAKVVQGLPYCNFDVTQIKRVKFPQYYQENYTNVAMYFDADNGDNGASGFLQLEEFVVDKENDYYIVRDHVLFAENETILCVYPPGLTATSYQIPEGVIKGGGTGDQDVFAYNPYLEEITFPRSYIGKQDMNDGWTSWNYMDYVTLPNLEKINVMDENPYWCSIDDALYKKEGDNKLTLYSYPAQKADQSFTVEENVSSIAHYGLYSKHLENITFKSPETEIGNGMSAVYIKNIYLDFYLSDQYDADMYLNDYYFQREYDLDDSAHFNFNIYIRNEKALACIAESLRSMVNVIYY